MTEYGENTRGLPPPLMVVGDAGETKAWDRLPVSNRTIVLARSNGKLYRKARGFEGEEVYWDEREGTFKDAGRSENRLSLDGVFDVYSLPGTQDISMGLYDDIMIVHELDAEKGREAVAKSVDDVTRIAQDQLQKTYDLLETPMEDRHAADLQSPFYTAAFKDIPMGTTIVDPRSKTLLLKKTGVTEARSRDTRRINTIATFNPETIVTALVQPGDKSDLPRPGVAA